MLRGSTQVHALAPQHYALCTMRGRVGVIFQGRGFESHRRRILQFYFQRKRGRIVSKSFAFVIIKAKCSPLATLANLDPEVWGSLVALLDFWFLLSSLRFSS